MALVSIVRGAGFIGSRLTAALLSAGYTVRVVDPVPAPSVTFEWRQADVRDALRLRRALHGSDIVYNLAAVHHDDVKPATLYDRVNVTGGQQRLRRLRIPPNQHFSVHQLRGRLR